MDDIGNHIVEVEFQRIQTFLFAVPRLREMLGANALLGTLIRRDLFRLAKDIGGTSLSYPHSLPSSYFCQPTAIDPLPQRKTDDIPLGDSPATCFNMGVLSRDGGHFHAVFPNRNTAKAFCDRALELIARQLPGLKADMRLSPWSNGKVKGKEERFRPLPEDLPDLPQFQVCRESGHGVASYHKQDKIFSRASYLKRLAGTRFAKGKGKYADTISLLRDQLPGYRTKKHPQDMEKLSDKSYIAVIHADGNRVGRRFTQWRETHQIKEKPPLEQEALTECFFHSLRVVVRRALVDALERVFHPEVLNENEILPYQLLMLGGDDLLLVCRPRFALPFVREYARALAKMNLADGRSLGVGAGVAIAKHNLPFHHLYDLAEELAGSAKQRYLQLRKDEKDGAEPSVVDWQVSTASWLDAPAKQRSRESLVSYANPDGKTELLALSAKPYRVIKAEPPQGDSLEELLEQADGLNEIKELPRSQLRTFLEYLPQGRRTAELAYREMLEHIPAEAKKNLPMVERDEKEGTKHEDTPWLEAGEDRHFTRLGDLIELTEIRYLGRKKQEVGHD